MYNYHINQKNFFLRLIPGFARPVPISDINWGGAIGAAHIKLKLRVLSFYFYIWCAYDVIRFFRIFIFCAYKNFLNLYHCLRVYIIKHLLYRSLGNTLLFSISAIWRPDCATYVAQSEPVKWPQSKTACYWLNTIQ